MSRSKRKWDHIRFALEEGEEKSSVMEDIQYIHNSLPDSSVDSVRLDHSIGGLYLSSPIFINAMTGGGGEKTYTINRDLAAAAAAKGLAMAVGSQMAALRDKTERKTYEVVREQNPNGIILANLGSEASPEHAKAAIDMIGADAIQIHLNVIQELTMPEGDRDFTGALGRIERIVNKVNVPVIIKETGFGMSLESVRLIEEAGVSAIDIGGYGGTNFARIENKRREKPLPFFNQWGNPTAVSIIEASKTSKNLSIIASGGIRSSLDIAKGISIGADAVGMAGPFLKVLLNHGFEVLQEYIDSLHEDLTLIMTALGAHSIKELQQVPLIVLGNTHHWLDQRGFNTKEFSQRKIIR